MRVALIINKFGIGGAERLAADEVRELRRRGITVDVFTLRGPASAPFGGRLIPFRSLFDIRALTALVGALRGGGYDALITHLWFANTIGRIAGTLADVTRILSFEHNVYDRVKTWKQFLIDRALQHRCTAVVAVSSAVKDSLVAHGIKSHRVIVMQNGVDFSRFKDVQKASGAERPFTFLFIGRLVEQKGPDVLLDALSHVPGARLVIAGDGVMREALERRARELGIAERVHFAGARDDVPELLAKADCFVFPSRWEGFGLSLLEAMAAGVPSIVSDIPAVRNLVRGEEALMVPPEDSRRLSEAMARMMKDTVLRKWLAREAWKVAEHFSISAHTDRVLAVLEGGALAPYVSSRIEAPSSSTPPVLASIIVNWNNYERTRGFVSSFSKSSFPGHEVIVVDNDSPNDATRRVQEEFPQYTYIYNDRNAGIAAANNIGMRYALARGARYVFLFNNDLEIVEDNFFEKMVGYMDEHPKTAMAAPRLIYPDGTPQMSIKRIPTLGNQIGEWIRPLRWYVKDERMQEDVIRKDYFVAASALLVRREAIEDIGFEDERFVLGYEDVDWCVRARAGGWDIRYVSGATITHWHGVSSKDVMRNADFYYREKMRFLMKYHSHFGMLFFRIVASAVSFARAALAFLSGSPSAGSYARLAYRMWTYPWRKRAYLTPSVLAQRV